MEELLNPSVKLGIYQITYLLDSGFLLFDRPTALLRMLAPPEFRSSMLAQSTREDAELILRTSRFVEHVIVVLDTQLLFSTR